LAAPLRRTARMPTTRTDRVPKPLTGVRRLKHWLDALREDEGQHYVPCRRSALAKLKGQEQRIEHLVGITVKARLKKRSAALAGNKGDAHLAHPEVHGFAVPTYLGESAANRHATRRLDFVSSISNALPASVNQPCSSLPKLLTSSASSILPGNTSMVMADPSERRRDLGERSNLQLPSLSCPGSPTSRRELKVTSTVASVARCLAGFNLLGSSTRPSDESRRAAHPHCVQVGFLERDDAPSISVSFLSTWRV
jgi:hypothetical protein